MIPVKLENDIQRMRVACQIVAQTHEHVAKHIKAGISTFELDAIAEDFILSKGAKPNFKGYKGYPAATCISINDVIVHGIPSKNIILKEGDIVSIDLGAVIKGFHGDAARTYGIGAISKERQRLIDITKQSFFEALKEARTGRRVGDISNAVQTFVEANGFSIVRSLVGHGIGRRLHEEPAIPNFGKKGDGPILRAGNTLAIEPMVNFGSFKVKFDADGWTCRTLDGSDSAHYENTVLITNGEPQILT